MDNAIHTLTAAERRIAEAYADGATFSEIAADLNRSPHTVRTHLRNIYRKLNVDTKIALRKALGPRAGRESPASEDQTQHISADLAAYRASWEQARVLDGMPQEATALVFADFVDRYPGFSGGYAGLSFLEGNFAFVAASEAEAATFLDKASRLGETALRLNPFDCDAQIAAGRSAAFRGEFDVALRHAECALTLDPQSEWAHYLLVFAKVFGGWHSAALDAAQSRLPKLRHPDVVEALHLTLAVACLAEGDRAGAVQYAQAVLQRGRANSCVQFVCCAILADNGREKQVSEVDLNMPPSTVMSPVQNRLHRNSQDILNVIARQQMPLEEMLA